MWLENSKSYIIELCRRTVGPESMIHHKLGPWQWQGESIFSVVYVITVLSKRYLYETMKDIKNQAMASESHDPAALVLAVLLKFVLRVAVRLFGMAGWNSRLKSVVCFDHHGQYQDCCTCTTDATSEGSPCLVISLS